LILFSLGKTTVTLETTTQTFTNINNLFNNKPFDNTNNNTMMQVAWLDSNGIDPAGCYLFYYIKDEYS
jgi:hypothetical protein